MDGSIIISYFYGSNNIFADCNYIFVKDPANMKTPLMRLLHIVKMIFNVSTFYNTPERVASLLVKITNQVRLLVSGSLVAFTFERIHSNAEALYLKVNVYIWKENNKIST